MPKYTNADALADLEHAAEFLEPEEQKRASVLLKRVPKDKPAAECFDSEIHAFFENMANGVASQPPPKPPRWQFWK